MALFKENIKTTPTVKVLQQCIPDVVINPEALVRMQLFVEGCADEIGWLGTAKKQGNTIYIEDVYLFDQEVHSTTTEITPEGLATFGEEILAHPEGMEIWNNLKVWGHSHVNMSVSPSGQDDSQMITFKDNGFDWFVRIIANKKGEIRVDLYNYSIGVIYNDLPWSEDITQEEEEIELQIAQLYHYLDEIKKNRVHKFEEQIKEEMKVKVRKKWGGRGAVTVIQNTHTTHTTYSKGEEKYTGGIKGTEDKKKLNNESKSVKINTGNNITTDGDVYLYFSEDALCEIGECTSIIQVQEEVEHNGYGDFFDLWEINKIWGVGKQVCDKVYLGKEIK